MPQVFITRRVENDGARYFGPYADAGSVRRTMELVKRLFPYRSCTKPITGTDERPCLDFHIHRCLGPCIGAVDPEDYNKVIRQVILFLEGKTKEVVTSLKGQMQTSSDELQFERAALFRDQIKAVENVAEKQVVERIRPTDEDVFGLARNEGTSEACVQVFFIRGTQMVGRDFFTLNPVEIPRGTGTGFVWDAEGHIVTNAHVAQSGNRFKVTLADGKTFVAQNKPGDVLFEPAGSHKVENIGGRDTRAILVELKATPKKT